MPFSVNNVNNNGTPLSVAQDASRFEEPQLQPSTPRPRADKSDEAEKQWAEDKNLALQRTGSESTTTTTDMTEKDVVHDTILTPPITARTARPALGARQISNASGAAAPYAGFGFDEIPFSLSRATTRQQQQQARGRSSSSASTTSTLRALPSAMVTASRVSTDQYGNTYPEGGREAYLCVFGSFCGLMSALGMMNTLGTFQAYLAANQLSHLPDSTTGWIFGVYAFLAFFCGIQIGPIFDAKGPRYLIAVGSVCILATYLLLGVCTAYWHFLIVFGVLGGLGTSLVFTPAIASIGHFFLLTRGQWTGLAAAGGSMGGIVYPLTLQALFPRIGFAWSTRVIALINLVLLVFANLFIKSRLPSRPATRESMLPDVRVFRDPIFALTTAGVFFVEWGLFIPLSYLTSYALANGLPSDTSYQLIAILNVGSCFGRYLPGLVADRLGRFNAMIVTIALCMLSTFALWLPAGDSLALLIVYALVFGFASGSGISLTPVCVGQLCKVENYGRYYATCYTVVSFASLTGIPLAGGIVTWAAKPGPDGNDGYWGLIVFTGCAYAVSTAVFIAARVKGAGWTLKKF